MRADWWWLFRPKSVPVANFQNARGASVTSVERHTAEHKSFWGFPRTTQTYFVCSSSKVLNFTFDGTVPFFVFVFLSDNTMKHKNTGHETKKKRKTAVKFRHQPRGPPADAIYTILYLNISVRFRSRPYNPMQSISQYIRVMSKSPLQFPLITWRHSVTQIFYNISTSETHANLKTRWVQNNYLLPNETPFEN